MNLCYVVDVTDEHQLRCVGGGLRKQRGGTGGEVLVRTNEGSKYRLMMLSPVSPHCDVTKVISLSLVHSFTSVFLR
jgi:hypothetical protein